MSPADWQGSAIAPSLQLQRMKLDLRVLAEAHHRRGRQASPEIPITRLPGEPNGQAAKRGVCLRRAEIVGLPKVRARYPERMRQFHDLEVHIVGDIRRRIVQWQDTIDTFDSGEQADQ